MITTASISSTLSTASYNWRVLSARNKKLLTTLLLLLCTVVYGNVAYLTVSKVHLTFPDATATATEPETSTSAATPNVAAATPAPTPAPQQSNAIVAPAAPRACSPSTYTLPSALDVSARPAGLTEVIDPIQYYGIYGATGSQARQQIQQCAPRQNSGDAAAEYTAQTGYYISWQYSYSTRADGLCVVGNAKIGLHVSMVMPSLEFSAGASESFKNQWGQFVTNLQGHENGHVELDRQYARQMLSDLQNFPASSCDTLQQSVNAAMRNVVTQLNLANDHYDDHTGHGATQGATIPS